MFYQPYRLMTKCFFPPCPVGLTHAYRVFYMA